MIDRHLELTTRDGQMNTFVTHPEEGGPHPVVFF
jgi:carboxymethylenebutenolidase